MELLTAPSVMTAGSPHKPCERCVPAAQTLRFKEILGGKLRHAGAEASTHYGRSGQLIAGGLYNVRAEGAVAGGPAGARSCGIAQSAAVLPVAKPAVAPPLPVLTCRCSLGSRSSFPCGNPSGAHSPLCWDLHAHMHHWNDGMPVLLAALQSLCLPPHCCSRAISMLAHNFDTRSAGCLAK